ncbi:MAG TPA: S8 family serine peptidase [Bacillota bacterium]
MNLGTLFRRVAPQGLVGRLASPRVPGQVLVKFYPEATNFHMNTAHRSVGAKVMGRLDKVGTQVVSVPCGQERRYVGLYARRKVVCFAEPNYLVHALYTPNDPYLVGTYESSHDGAMAQYWLPKIAALEAWDGVKSLTNGPILAIVDTGIDYNHPDLASKMVRDASGKVIGHNFIDGTDDALDDNGHGTHCAGIAAAATDNAVGVAGVSFNAVRLMPVKVLDKGGSGSVANVAAGVTWASDHGAKIISLSLGASTYSQTLQDAIRHAHSEGAIVVAAAGNDGRAIANYPGANLYALGVAATGPDDLCAGFSNWNIGVGVAAPGVAILSTLPSHQVDLNSYGYRQDYDCLDGTSMATPVVSGLLGLLLAAQAGIDPGEAVGRLQATARNVAATAGDGWGTHYGYGRVDVQACLAGAARQGKVGSIYGQVVNGYGIPVKFGKVSANGKSTRTGFDGMFRLANLPAGTHSLTGGRGCPRSKRTAGTTVEVKPGRDTLVTLTVKG